MRIRFRWRLRHRGGTAGETGKGAGVAKANGLASLDQLEPGDAGTVVELRACGPLRRRMLDMGLIPGTAVEVLRVAPLGDPMEVRIRGYNLSLRKKEAATIAVWIR